MVEFFDWLSDASPWLWLALGIMLVAVEILAPSFILVWPGLAAMCMAVLVWLAPRAFGAGPHRHFRHTFDCAALCWPRPHGADQAG